MKSENFFFFVYYFKKQIVISNINKIFQVPPFLQSVDFNLRFDIIDWFRRNRIKKNVTLFMILPSYLYVYIHFKSFQVAIIIHTTNSKMSMTLHPESAENIPFGSQVSDLCL